MDKLNNQSSVSTPLLDESAVKPSAHMPTAVGTNIKLTLIVDYVFWVLVAIVLLRFAFKIIGANAANAFVNLIYSLTNGIVGAFQGIVGDVASGNMIVEFSSLITVVILWLIYKAVLRLITIVNTSTRS